MTSRNPAPIQRITKQVDFRYNNFLVGAGSKPARNLRRTWFRAGLEPAHTILRNGIDFRKINIGNTCRGDPPVAHLLVVPAKESRTIFLSF